MAKIFRYIIMMILFISFIELSTERKIKTKEKEEKTIAQTEIPQGKLVAETKGSTEKKEEIASIDRGVLL